ncbi:MAG TPA: PHB depolymerase family esterase, partial [Candidatus Acidoferrales bacterium]|nr:PHB depolymerase family esterase [Candidatus Acidoferrales bacterium]
MKRVMCAAIALAAVTCGNSSNPGASSTACGPFGDPSAAVFPDSAPSCGDGKLLGPWKDFDGTDRYACDYEPASADASRKLPMIVFLHPSLFSARWITQTNLLEYQNSVSLSADPKHFGYIVLAPEGRNTTHYYPFPDNKGIGWDNWYRQLNPSGDVKIGETTWRENADAAAIDHFIATRIAAGGVDGDRIYVTGWSNGAAMGILYALNRPNVAAVAVYSAPNPFGALGDPCPQRPVAGPLASDAEIKLYNPAIPTMHLHNSCDIGGICPSGELLRNQLTNAGVSVDDVILDWYRRRVSVCNDSCGTDPNGEMGL